jgi:hypothetical protein
LIGRPEFGVIAGFLYSKIIEKESEHVEEDLPAC